jgi:probable phosphoglycerate mutase
LIRHGEAQVHVDGILGGEKYCSGLSTRGRRQAEALRDRFKATGELGEVGVLYASSLPRAVETAEIISPALGHPELRLDRDLREFDPGEADGLTWEEFQARYPQPEVRDPHRRRTPTSETWAEFGERVERAIGRIANEHMDQTVVIACHGGVIEQTFHLWGLSTLNGLHLEVENTGITEFHWTDPWPWHTGSEPSWRLVRHNDAAHLLNIL